VSFHIC